MNAEEPKRFLLATNYPNWEKSIKIPTDWEHNAHSPHLMIFILCGTRPAEVLERFGFLLGWASTKKIPALLVFPETESKVSGSCVRTSWGNLRTTTTLNLEDYLKSNDFQSFPHPIQNVPSVGGFDKNWMIALSILVVVLFVFFFLFAGVIRQNRTTIHENDDTVKQQQEEIRKKTEEINQNYNTIQGQKNEIKQQQSEISQQKNEINKQKNEISQQKNEISQQKNEKSEIKQKLRSMLDTLE